MSMQSTRQGREGATRIPGDRPGFGSFPASDQLPPAAGQRLASHVCSTSVIVLDPGFATTALLCGGVPMREGRYVACSQPDQFDAATMRVAAGAIYRDDATGITVRCIRSGTGPLTMRGRRLRRRRDDEFSQSEFDLSLRQASEVCTRG